MLERYGGASITAVADGRSFDARGIGAPVYNVTGAGGNTLTITNKGFPANATSCFYTVTQIAQSTSQHDHHIRRGGGSSHVSHL